MEEVDHDQAQKKYLSFKWPRKRRNMKLFINLKKNWFLNGFIYAVMILPYYAIMILLLPLIKCHSVQSIKQQETSEGKS